MSANMDHGHRPNYVMSATIPIPLFMFHMTAQGAVISDEEFDRWVDVWYFFCF